MKSKQSVTGQSASVEISSPLPVDRDAEPRSVQAPALVSRGSWLAEILKERILSGHYKPGERIREADLQKEFGFSNGPVREALKLTVSATLAESGAPWQGVRVVELNRAEIGELFQLRTALLEYIAERAARFASPETLEKGAALKANLSRTFAPDGPPMAGDLSSWLLDGAGNAMLRQTWDAITLRSRIYVNDALRKEGGAGSMKRLSALIDAVMARNPGAARNAARILTQELLRGLDVDVEL
jgi:DNA-binding GntR family transcriptional regulator